MHVVSHILSLLSMDPVTPRAPDSNSTALPLLTHLVHQFPIGSWVENVAVRSSGELLLTMLTTPELYSLSPSKPSSPELVHTFADYTGLLGIAETSPDVFAMVVGNLTSLPYVMDIWKVDFNGAKIEVSKVTTVLKAGLLNGATALPHSEVVLIADSFRGLVWKVNVNTGETSIAIELPEMLAPANSTNPTAINGLKIHDGYLYWTNYAGLSFYRTQINLNGSLADGAKVEFIANLGAQVDDLAIDKSGTSWVTTHPGNTVVAVGRSGETATVAGSLESLDVAAGTSCAFGRTPHDEHVLYVATAGATINGTTEGGKVVALNTRGFRIEDFS
ncbi:hypothetical protein B0O99DRAFT_630027 [Bisporella sp. PMI_857]|nr:hypothetical protein B0O99DRAFT_630027 [Bisporella sp. PMI_857]